MDDGCVVLMNEERGEFGHADENADRVGLLEYEQGTVVGTAAGLKVIARADVALGDDACVGSLDLAVLDDDPGFSLVGPGHSEVGSCGLDVDSGLVAARDRHVAVGGRLRDERFGLVARGGRLLELAIGLVTHLHVQHALADKGFESLVFRLPASVAGLRPLHSGPGRNDPSLGRLHLCFGGAKRALRHVDLHFGPVHGGELLSMGLHQVRDPHIDENIAFPDAIANVEPVLLSIPGDPRIDRRCLEGLDRARLNHHHPDVAAFQGE